MKKLVFGLIATVVFGFVGNAQDLRAKFLEGKTQDEIVADFNKLNDSEKTALWVEKMDQLLNEDLPKENKVVISELRDMLLKNGYSSKVDGFVETVINLAKITPLEDFEKMFCSLNDYTYNEKFIGTEKVPEEILSDLININNPINDVNLLDRKRDCSCRWSCWMTGGTASTKCVITDGGCGFFLMQDCTHYPG